MLFVCRESIYMVFEKKIYNFLKIDFLNIFFQIAITTLKVIQHGLAVARFRTSSILVEINKNLYFFGKLFFLEKHITESQKKNIKHKTYVELSIPYVLL